MQLYVRRNNTARSVAELARRQEKNYSKYMDLVEEVKEIEKELVELIVTHLKANKIDADTARQQAKDFLAVLPVKDQKDLLQKLHILGDKYYEAKEVYAGEIAKVHEQIREQALSQMRDNIQQGNIDAAIAVAKAVNQPN